MLRPFLLLPICALGACAIPTSQSSMVVLTDSKVVVEDCTKLGDIDGSSAIGRVLLLDKARDAALARLKIRATELGGTHVLTSVADIKWKGPSTSGQVYLCAVSRTRKQT